MASTRHKRKSASSHPITGRYTRSSSGLRVATKMQPQTLPNHRQCHRKCASATTRKIASNKNRASHRRQPNYVPPPQRSSLRRALRESLELSKRAMQLSMSSPTDLRMPPASSTIASIPMSSTRAKLQVSGQQSKYRGQEIRTGTKGSTGTITTTTRSSRFAHASALKLNPQRTSLRIAIRESLEVMNSPHEDLVQPANHTKPMAAQSPELESLFNEKSKTEARNLAVSEGSPRRHTPLSENSKTTTVSLATSRRSSVRRIVRKNSHVTEQGNVSVNTATREMGSGRNSVIEHFVKEVLQSQDGANSGALSLPHSSPALSSDTYLTPPDVGSSTGTPSQLVRTSSESSTTASPPSFMVTRSRSRSLASSRPHQKLAQESSLVTKPSTPRIRPSLPKTPPQGALNLVGRQALPTDVAQQQIPTSTSPTRSILSKGKPQDSPDNSQSIATRRGWHQVREIINEAPGGLYLVEWEGRDPRTGVKWPASWIQAKNVSASAVRHWETRKKERTD
ncbi:hypothetical protein F4825DRAFT_391121 [Nemania diffusa]|nr:hypothetical protein F4825DRAFT_391121 [Nemania diffusa]